MEVFFIFSAFDRYKISNKSLTSKCLDSSSDLNRNISLCILHEIAQSLSTMISKILLVLAVGVVLIAYDVYRLPVPPESREPIKIRQFLYHMKLLSLQVS